MLATEDSVWSRTSAPANEIISDRAYNIVLGLTLLWGFAVNYVMVQSIPIEAVMQVPFWGLIVGYFISAFVGISIYTNSDKPLFSFIGYEQKVALLLVLPAISYSSS